MMTVVGAAAHNLLLVKHSRFFAVHSLHFCRIQPKSQFADMSLPRCARLEFPCQKALIFGVGLVAGYRCRVHSYESIGKIQVLQSLILLIFYLLCCFLLIGDKMEIGNKRDEEDHPNLDALLSAFEILSIVPSAIISIGCAVNYTFLGPNKSFQPSFLNKFFVWQCVFLVGAVAISSFIRQRQWRRISKVSYKTGSKSFNLVDRIEKLEEDIKNSARIIRVLTRQVEKLGIRFRVTRKTLKGPITETAALAQKNSEATRALALQEDNLEKELGEIQKALLAMQDQQRKQLELIVAIGKSGLLRQSRQNHVAGDNGNLLHSSSSETREAENKEGEGGHKDLKAV